MKFFCVIIGLLAAYSGMVAAATTAATTQAQTGSTAAPGRSSIAPTGTTAQPNTNMMTTNSKTMASGTTSAGKTGMTTSFMNSTTPSGNSTENGPITTEAVTTPTPVPSPRFVVNNSDGEPCMLLNFDAMMAVRYETTDGQQLESTFPVTNTSSFEGSCKTGEVREFSLFYPNKDLFCAVLNLWFNVTSNTIYYNRNGITVRFIEPCVLPSAKNYNTLIQGVYRPSYSGTIGKSYKCNSVMNKGLNFDVTLNNVLIQPFAQQSVDKGQYGDIETCKEPVLTTKQPPVTATVSTPHQPTKPSPNNAGMIAGIVIGVLVFVAVIIGSFVFVIRRRRQKRLSYGQL